MALRTIATVATILCVMLPAAAHAQRAKTACNDGTTTTATGPDACNGHRGVNRAHTATLHRAPSGSQEPARVSQAGTPASRDSHAQPEEHRGWRWFHRNHDEKREHVEERHERRYDRDRVRCRDGRYEEMKVNHGHGRGPDVCKHHGGIAH